MKPYLAFDLEIATDVPGEDFNQWRNHRPLGITCAATLSCEPDADVDVKNAECYHGKTDEGKPAERMSTEEVVAMLDAIEAKLKEGYHLLSWNGLGFDLEVLAEESQQPERCKKLALEHTDMMFHLFCQKGFPVALNKAAQALELRGKPTGMDGSKAPALWSNGEYQKVLDYCAHDTRITLELAQRCDKNKSFKWITRKGSISSMPLPEGWLNVAESLELPEADTSWMSDPIPRSRFTQWMDAIKA